MGRGTVNCNSFQHVVSNVSYVIPLLKLGY